MGRVKRINNKFYDTGTKNKSFLQVAKDLKRLGIQNFYFMLEIKDVSLVDVDPFSPDLTQEEIMKITHECTVNCWYYLREICRIPAPGGQPSRFIANRGNIAQIWCTLHGLDSWLCLPRQQGKTVSALALITWAYSFGTNDSSFIFINKDSGNAKENLERVKKQIDLLPEYLRFEQILEEDENGKQKITKAVRNATSMKHPVTHNNIRITSKATSYSNALTLARGLTSPWQHFDEPEFTNFIKTIVENSYPTFDTAARIAKKNGALYGRIFSCTPGDLDTTFGQEAQELLQNTCKWTERMYDMHYDPYNDENNEILQYVLANGENKIVYIEYSYKQIGLDDNWLRNMYASMSPMTVKRECLLQRLRGSSDSPFDREDVDYIVSSVWPVIDEVYLQEHFRLDIYTPLERRTPYLVGIDCSTGTNSDNNAITVLDPYTVQPVAEFKCAYIGETMFEKLIIELIQKYIPRSCVVIERNSVGDSIIDHLLSSPIAMNLYFDKNKDLVETKIFDESHTVSMLKRAAEEKKYYGVYTQKGNREDMMNILKRHVSEFKDKFITKNIAEDIAGLVQDSSGKILAPTGKDGKKHDDSVMSYLMTLYVYYHGNNLKAFNIYKDRVSIEKPIAAERIYDPYDLRGILPDREIEVMRNQAEIRRQNNYDEILRRYAEASQKNSIQLARSSLNVKNSTIDSTPDELLDDDTSGYIPMDFFRELNGY